ncbi:MAG: aminotransferase class V-fold PLP-dependent enzyme [Candidatus Thorarchaeota archaeon]|nr:aminotransferase class V-fold PLP-dependent enzyme [Candidatus Thorarchaeota archaeon]
MAHQIDSDLIDKEFPTLSNMTYLNNASTGIPPARMTAAVRDYLGDRAAVRRDFEDTLALFKDIRNRLAEMIGGARNNYGLVPSTSAGLNAIAHSIDYTKESNVVVCDLEFPANYIPWQNVEHAHGAELRVVESVEGAIPPKRFAEAVDENTKVLAVSLIQFGTGYRSDLKVLAKLIHDVGGYLVVDVIQAAGCVDFDLVESGVDFAAGQSAKWLIGPIGAGYVYASESAVDEVHPITTGWWGVKNLVDFSYHDRKLLPDARRFQGGSSAMMAYVGFRESLDVLLEIEPKTREEAAMNCADYLRKRLAEEGIDYYDFSGENKSAIVSCTPEEPEVLNEKLNKHRIYCSVRNGRLRVSPHFYNSEKDIDTLMEYVV